MIRRPPRSTQSRSSAASDVYKRQRRGVDVGSQQTVLGAHDLEEAPGARVTQPLAERSGEPHLFAVDDFARDEAFDGFLDNVLAFAVAQFHAVSYTHLRAHETRHDL